MSFKRPNFKLPRFKLPNLKLPNFRLLWCVCALIAVGGCATTEQSTDHVVHLTTGATVISTQQLLTISYQGKQDKALVMLEGQDASLKLSVLNPLGIRLVDASYEQGQLQVIKHLPLDQLPPAQQVLFDIFLGLLPEEDIRAVLPSGFSLTDNGALRTISDSQGQVIEQVHFTPTKGNQSRSATMIEHYVFGYVIEIENL